MSSPRHPSPDGQAGFTLVETLVAAALLLIGLVATLTIVEQASSVTVKTRTREQATNLQRELVEATRSVSYDRLTANGLTAEVQARPALGDGVAGGAWTIRRRDVTYTVALGVCSVDDPRDGTGAHVAGVFCADDGTPPADANQDGILDALVSASATACPASCTVRPGSTQFDPTPADYKRVVSLVRWPTGANVQSSQINNPGLAAAPAVATLVPAANPVNAANPATTSLGFTATTTGTPVTVTLYLDGTALTPPMTQGVGNWTGAWGLGAIDVNGDGKPDTGEVLDGSYELSAKAFDGYGQYGATRSQVVTVNRRVAYAPVFVEAGRNGTAVEIEWSPAKERDSEGFRVDRRIVVGSEVLGADEGWVMACDRAVRTACRDGLAPPAVANERLEYSVVGYDRDTLGAVRAGSRSAPRAIVDPPPAVPNPPGTLQATLAGADVELTWTAPASGPVPDHYNVYRDGQAYGDRLDSFYLPPAVAGEPAPQLKYVDTRTGGTAHNYWVTAVNDDLGESVALGPVNR